MKMIVLKNGDAVLAAKITAIRFIEAEKCSITGEDRGPRVRVNTERCGEYNIPFDDNESAISYRDELISTVQMQCSEIQASDGGNYCYYAYDTANEILK